MSHSKYLIILIMLIFIYTSAYVNSLYIDLNYGISSLNDDHHSEDHLQNNVVMSKNALEIKVPDNESSYVLASYYVGYSSHYNIINLTYSLAIKVQVVKTNISIGCIESLSNKGTIYRFGFFILDNNTSIYIIEKRGYNPIVIYSRKLNIDPTKPHRYSIVIKTSRIFFYIDDVIKYNVSVERRLMYINWITFGTKTYGNIYTIYLDNLLLKIDDAVFLDIDYDKIHTLPLSEVEGRGYIGETDVSSIFVFEFYPEQDSTRYVIQLYKYSITTYGGNITVELDPGYYILAVSIHNHTYYDLLTVLPRTNQVVNYVLTYREEEEYLSFVKINPNGMYSKYTQVKIIYPNDTLAYIENTYIFNNTYFYIKKGTYHITLYNIETKYRNTMLYNINTKNLIIKFKNPKIYIYSFMRAHIRFSTKSKNYEFVVKERITNKTIAPGKYHVYIKDPATGIIKHTVVSIGWNIVKFFYLSFFIDGEHTHILFNEYIPNYSTIIHLDTNIPKSLPVKVTLNKSLLPILVKDFIIKKGYYRLNIKYLKASYTKIIHINDNTSTLKLFLPIVEIKFFGTSQYTYDITPKPLAIAYNKYLIIPGNYSIKIFDIDRNLTKTYRFNIDNNLSSPLIKNIEVYVVLNSTRYEIYVREEKMPKPTEMFFILKGAEKLDFDSLSFLEIYVNSIRVKFKQIYILSGSYRVEVSYLFGSNTTQYYVYGSTTIYHIIDAAILYINSTYPVNIKINNVPIRTNTYIVIKPGKYKVEILFNNSIIQSFITVNPGLNIINIKEYVNEYMTKNNISNVAVPIILALIIINVILVWKLGIIHIRIFKSIHKRKKR